MSAIDKERLALIPRLAERSTTGHIGRTALMKYLYFLQTLRGVPLGYGFSMYSYGPFDSDVLMDLHSASSLGIVAVTTVEFSGGYGYRIAPGPRAQTAKEQAAEFLARYENDINWVCSVFGSLNSAELELASTIVYVDREFYDSKENTQLDEIVGRVREIKPRFTDGQVKSIFQMLLGRGVLVSTHN